MKRSRSGCLDKTWVSSAKALASMRSVLARYHGLGEIPRLAGIDDRHGETGRLQGTGRVPLQATGGLHDDQIDGFPCQPGQQRILAAILVGEGFDPTFDANGSVEGTCDLGSNNGSGSQGTVTAARHLLRHGLRGPEGKQAAPPRPKQRTLWICGQPATRFPPLRYAQSCGQAVAAHKPHNVSSTLIFMVREETRIARHWRHACASICVWPYAVCYLQNRLRNPGKDEWHERRDSRLRRVDWPPGDH